MTRYCRDAITLQNRNPHWKGSVVQATNNAENHPLNYTHSTSEKPKNTEENN